MNFTTKVQLSVEIKNFERFDNIKFDYVMDLDVSSPLRNISDIKKCV